MKSLCITPIIATVFSVLTSWSEMSYTEDGYRIPTEYPSFVFHETTEVTPISALNGGTSPDTFTPITKIVTAFKPPSFDMP